MNYEALGRIDIGHGAKIRLRCDHEPDSPIPIVHQLGYRFRVCQGTRAEVISDGLISINGIEAYTVRILDGPRKGDIGQLPPFAAHPDSAADQAEQPAATLPPGWSIVQPD